MIQDLGTLGGANSTAIDINASGQVIGISDVFGRWPARLPLDVRRRDAGSRHAPSSPASSVVAINDAGQIAGSYVAPSGDTHAFLYTPGSGLRDLGTLGGTTSSATGLNAQGAVVGSSTTSQGATHAFLWTSTDGMEDVTAVSGFAAVRKLNDDLQTLSGGVFGAFPPPPSAFLITLEVTLTWPFTGFGPPIDAVPALNSAHAGHTVTLRFGLGGDRGLGIFAAGSPSSTQVSCTTGAPIGSATPVSPADLELRYQAGPDRYTLRWQTSSRLGGHLSAAQPEAHGWIHPRRAVQLPLVGSNASYAEEGRAQVLGAALFRRHPLVHLPWADRGARAGRARTRARATQSPSSSRW